LSQRRSTTFIDAPPIDDSSSSAVVLFAATRWELAAIRRAMPVERRIDVDGVSCFIGRRAGRTYWLVPTGIGPEAADVAASAVLTRHRAALAISAGFAGALMPATEVGDVIVATSVVSGTFDGAWSQAGAPIVCEETVLRVVRSAGAAIGVAVHGGPVVSLSNVLCRAVEKRSLSRLTGALALDMESAAIGNVAHSQGVPFAVVRTVSDVASEDLPLDFNAFLKPWGWVRGIGAMIMTPSSLIGLNRLRRQSRVAAERLTAICAACAVHDFGLSPVSQAGRA
jgi:adenosylhomocysteine nucleosidase